MKRAIFIVIVIVLAFVINNQIRSIYDLWQKKDLVIKAEKQLEYLKEENKKLKSELSYAETKEFIEKEARDKLLWVKPGEEQVLIPEKIIKKSVVEEQEEKVLKPNWQQWWEMFF